MTKQVLSIEQMHHLQKLGINTSNASAGWYKPDMDTEYFHVFSNAMPSQGELIGNEDCIPAYTLQDVLDLLPKHIGGEYSYNLCITPESISYTEFIAGEMNEIVHEVPIGCNLIDSACAMLCWCIKNGYVKAGKEELP